MDVANYWFDVRPPGSSVTSGSLRFRGNQYLQAVNTLTTTLNVQTWSLWFKRGSLTGYNYIIGSNNGYGFGFDAAYPNQLSHNGTGGVSNEYFRDPSAWYHLVVSGNTTTTRQWINGVELTGITKLLEPYWTSVDKLEIGTLYSPQTTTYGFDGHMAGVHFVDGLALDPTDFGEYNADGVWVPVEPSGLTYGANGFHLTFADPGDIGKDYSGNGNDFTATGFDTVTTDPTYDLMEDNPTNNFATLNPLQVVGAYNSTLTDANLTGTNATGGAMVKMSTIGMTGGKYYWEHTCTRKGSNYPMLGISQGNKDSQWGGAASYSTSVYYASSGNKFVFSSTGLGVAYGDPYTVGDVIGIAYDTEGGDIEFFKNGVSQGVATNIPEAERQYMVPGSQYGYSSIAEAAVNHGQQPFNYTPPAGFEPLNTASMPTPTIANGRDHFRAITGPGPGGGTLYTENVGTGDPATNDYPLGSLTDPVYTGASNYTPTYPASGNVFVWDAGGEILTVDITWWSITSSSGNQIYIYSADGQTWFGEHSLPDATLTITHAPGQLFRYIRKISVGTPGLMSFVSNGGFPILDAAKAAFPSGLWWIKDRANANQHQLVDSMRGGNLALTSPTIGPEVAYTAPTGDSVAWCWNYNAASPAQNGFDIVTYSGTGVTRTVNHSLGSAPEFMIVKNRDNVAPNSHFCIYHASVGATKTAYLESSSAFFPDSGMWANTEPTANQFTVGANYAVNNSGQDIVAYLWTSVPGYSAFGSYTGNGSADGAFVYTGFRPAFVMTKSTNQSYQWMIVDSTRNVTNPVNTYLFANSTSAEQTASTFDLDFLSNGFKLRSSTATDNNASGITYIYAAFAENPFGGSNISPVTAR